MAGCDASGTSHGNARDPIDWMRLSRRPHAFERRHVFRHCHHFGAGQRLRRRVALHVIAWAWLPSKILMSENLKPRASTGF
jgi:hypothetical protein